MAPAGSDGNKCECEASRHFDGGDGHAYGIDNGPAAPHVSVWGTFRLCLDCQEHCFPEWDQ